MNSKTVYQKEKAEYRLANTMKERITYFDTYRFIAAMMIFLTHFIHTFSRVSFRYFHMMPYSLVLEAVRGSLGVQMLCVILGYFAYKKGANSKDSLVALSFKRYTYFVVMAIVYYIIASVVGWLSVGDGFFHSLGVLAKEALLLTDKYNGLFWTLPPMLIGSIFCYVIGRAHLKTDGIIAVACAILLMKNAWIFNCVLGCFVAVWQDDKLVKKFMSRWYLQLPAFIITLAAIRTDHESKLLYVLQGVFCLTVLVITMNNDRLAGIMGARIWTYFNRSYFSLYIFHSALYHNLGKTLMYMDGAMPYKVRFILVFLLLTMIIVILSKPLDIIVNFIIKHLNHFIDNVEQRFFCFFSKVNAG